MDKFIYVFSEDARDALLAKRYDLLASDKKNSTYVFVNDGREDFARCGVSYILSNTLNF